MAAYAFSRFKVPGKDDLMFFILSTRMMPPIAVAIPIYLMYRELGLSDTKLGMILLYSAVNVSLAVWLLKGFIDEIPREYEDAAMVDGYTRLQAFRKVVLPQATTGIVATAIFCLIFAWNEYAFAVLLTSGEAQTAPPFIPIIIGEGGQDWPAVAAGHHAVPGADPRLHRAAAQTPAARHHFRRGAQMRTSPRPSRRSGCAAARMEMAACIVIALGIFMMLQPFSITRALHLVAHHVARDVHRVHRSDMRSLQAPNGGPRWRGRRWLGVDVQRIVSPSFGPDPGSSACASIRVQRRPPPSGPRMPRRSRPSG